MNELATFVDELRAITAATRDPREIVVRVRPLVLPGYRGGVAARLRHARELHDALAVRRVEQEFKVKETA